MRSVKSADREFSIMGVRNSGLPWLRLKASGFGTGGGVSIRQLVSAVFRDFVFRDYSRLCQCQLFVKLVPLSCFGPFRPAPATAQVVCVRFGQLFYCLRQTGGLEFKAHRLCASLNSRLESNKGE